MVIEFDRNEKRIVISHPYLGAGKVEEKAAKRSPFRRLILRKAVKISEQG